jgi:superfamily II DNA or RNA helicase
MDDYFQIIQESEPGFDKDQKIKIPALPCKKTTRKKTTKAPTKIFKPPVIGKNCIASCKYAGNPGEILAYCTEFGVIVPVNTSDACIKKLKSKFSLPLKTISGFVSIRNIWKSFGDCYSFPRFGMIELARTHQKLPIKIVNNIKPLPPTKKSFEWTGTLKPNQQIAADHIIANHFSDKNLALGNAGVILNLDTGQGKTFVALGIAAKLQQKTLIVTHTTDIATQWIELIHKLFGFKPGEWFGGKHTDGPIIVSVINSVLISMEKHTQDVKSIGLMVLDEVEKYASEKRREIFYGAHVPYMLGLSATPEGRIDNLNDVVKWQVGPVLVAENLAGYKKTNEVFYGNVTKLKYIAPREFSKRYVRKVDDQTSTHLLITQMSLDPYRNNMIVDKAVKLLGAATDYNVFIFSEYLFHLELLRDMIRERGQKCAVEYNEKKKSKPIVQNVERTIQKVSGGAAPEAMKDAREHAKIILTTYGFMGTGSSIQRMNAVIFATPRRNHMKQFSGRILRSGSDTMIRRQLIDVVDHNISLKSQWYERRKIYLGRKFTIENETFDASKNTKHILTWDCFDMEILAKCIKEKKITVAELLIKMKL